MTIAGSPQAPASHRITADDQTSADDRVARLCPPMPRGGWLGWLAPTVTALIALVLRLPNLSQPRSIVFDETYYAKDALSLLLFGYERQAVEGADQRILESTGDPQALAELFNGESAFVVHPPFGKWLIAAGEHVFGMTPFGWRIAALVAGVLSVVLAARILRRISRSNLIGTIAGFLVALDGLHIVMSRTALLDGFLMLFVLIGFGCVVLDRDWVRRRLTQGAVRLWWRPWLLAAGVSLGLACGVKWSGIYYLAAFGLMAVIWTVGARRAAGQTHPWLTVARRDILPAFLILVPIAVVTYVATWTGWFISDGGWDRQWAAQNPGGRTLIPDALRSLWHYHREAWGFHTNLSTPHSYSANPWTWPVQGRPTSFFYENSNGVCGAKECAQEVLALGNPIAWWAAVLALFHQLWRWVARRDWRSGAVLCGFA
ncbi:MAG: phospholipid carrier-dependent glycosyltransferase, partial [Candidatus Nanopelagicales bacterium]|nr:phospholipid carrier-dependent glycosyltransferase [Candidatus Nanopelagicales bacterium]